MFANALNLAGHPPHTQQPWQWLADWTHGMTQVE
jgi:hypothetical protein